MAAPPLETRPRLVNCRGRLLDLSRPQVMAIVNLTPDSFSDGGKVVGPEAAVARAGELLSQGADVLDIGGVSSRPGAPEVSEAEELARLSDSVAAIAQAYPEALLSIDTTRARVAEAMIAQGAHLINDISAGADPEMMAVAARHRVPLVLMHMQGTPANMQQNPSYGDVVAEVRQYLVERINAARAAGVADVIVDPGFGFGKTVVHNYRLFNELDQFATLGAPLLVGLSRKSMLTKVLGVAFEAVGPAAAALHFQALRAGASLLRVHEVAPAVQLVRLFGYVSGSEAPSADQSTPG